MSMDTPSVSVLLPVRDGEPWIAAALASVLGQTFRDIEVLVLEDGSRDGTPDVLRACGDPRVRVVPTGGVGIARALNIGMAQARGRYLARQDADDESRPDRLRRQVAALDARPDIDVVASVADYVDADGRPLSDAWVQTVRRQQDPARTPEQVARLMPLTCCITHGSVMLRAEVLRAAGGYRPEMVPAEDYDLWLRLLPAHRFLKLPEPLYRYRVHAAQSGQAQAGVQAERAVLAKLGYLRRAYPVMPTPAVLAIAGGGRGDAVYRQAARAAGFVVAGVRSSWHVLAVTDFAAVPRWREELSHSPTAVGAQVGNLFVAADGAQGTRAA